MIKSQQTHQISLLNESSVSKRMQAIQDIRDCVCEATKTTSKRDEQRFGGVPSCDCDTPPTCMNDETSSCSNVV